LFLVLAFCVPPVLPAQEKGYRPPPSYTAGGKADQAEGASILQEFLRNFRATGIAGTYWLSFDLRVMPRKGDERTLRGELLGSRNESGPISRLTLPGGTAGKIGEQRWLIQSGPQPWAATWIGATGKTATLTEAETFAPIAGTELTLFDLQMPFLYWPDFVYEGVAKVRGRPAHSFVLYPPADVAAARPQLTGVRVQLDTQFQALVQAELLGIKGATEKTITILELKKVGDQYMVKSIDLRNSLTRDKTRFSVTAAAMQLDLPGEAFTPAALAGSPPPVPAAKIERF
jgi:hypothetical protein